MAPACDQNRQICPRQRTTPRPFLGASADLTHLAFSGGREINTERLNNKALPLREMSRIAVTSCMYLGDVSPFIPVARRLHEAGHDVTFIAPEGFRPSSSPSLFRTSPTPSTAHREPDSDPVHTKLMRHPFVNAGRLATFWMDRAFADDPAAATASLREGMSGADVVVTHPTMASVTFPIAPSDAQGSWWGTCSR